MHLYRVAGELAGCHSLQKAFLYRSHVLARDIIAREQVDKVKFGVRALRQRLYSSRNLAILARSTSLLFVGVFICRWLCDAFSVVHLHPCGI